MRTDGPMCSRDGCANGTAMWRLEAIVGSSAICFRNTRRHVTVIVRMTARSSGCSSSVAGDASKSDESPALRHTA
jgi:hypothetical protein